MICVCNFNIRFSDDYRRTMFDNPTAALKIKEILKLKTERQKTWHTSFTNNIRAHLKLMIGDVSGSIWATFLILEDFLIFTISKSANVAMSESDSCVLMKPDAMP